MRRSPNCVSLGDTIQYAGTTWTVTSLHPYGVVLTAADGRTTVRRYIDCAP